MQDDLLTLESRLTLQGSIELLLPNQQKLISSRMEWTLLAEPAYQNLELKMSLAADQLALAEPFFTGLVSAPVQRFRLRPEILTAILPDLETAEQNESWLKVGAGALLCLENYRWIGPSGWFESVETPASVSS